MNRNEVLSQISGSTENVAAATILVGLISDSDLEFINSVSSKTEITLNWTRSGPVEKILEFKTVDSPRIIHVKYQSLYIDLLENDTVDVLDESALINIENWFSKYFNPEN